MNNQKPNSIRRPKLASLSFIVALWTAGIIAIAMTAYAVWQYYAHPGITVGELLRNHLWHVLILGAVIHASLWTCLHYLLVRPLNSIHKHLYNLGGGNVSELKIRTSIEEIQTVVDGINMMIWRLEKWIDSDALADARNQIEKIGLIATELRAENQDIAEAILKRVEQLETDFFTVVKSEKVTDEAADAFQPSMIDHNS